MASITIEQLSSDLNIALGDFAVVLTVLLPVERAGETFNASQDANRGVGFLVESDGHTDTSSTTFFINRSGGGDFPAKGWVLSCSSDAVEYKVMETSTDAAHVLLSLICARRYVK